MRSAAIGNWVSISSLDRKRLKMKRLQVCLDKLTFAHKAYQERETKSGLFPGNAQLHNHVSNQAISFFLSILVFSYLFIYDNLALETTLSNATRLQKLGSRKETHKRWC